MDSSIDLGNSVPRYKLWCVHNRSVQNGKWTSFIVFVGEIRHKVELLEPRL